MRMCLNCTRETDLPFCCKGCELSSLGDYKYRPSKYTLEIFGGILTVEDYHDIDTNTEYIIHSEFLPYSNPYITVIERIEEAPPKVMSKKNPKRVKNSQRQIDNVVIDKDTDDVSDFFKRFENKA